MILKYAPDEARNLKAYGDIPESAKINDTDMVENENDVITFNVLGVTEIPRYCRTILILSSF